MATVLFASAVPDKVGVLSFVIPSVDEIPVSSVTLIIVGILGAVVSMVKLCVVVPKLKFPA